MKSNTSLKVILFACVGALASCATQPVKTRVPVSATIRPDPSLSGQVFQAVNGYRKSHNASVLQRHAGLDRLAQQHCEYLRNHRGEGTIYGKNVSHIGFQGRSLVARERYNMMSISENVAAANQPGKDAPSVLVKLWSESKDHEYNMRSEWTHTGIGTVVDSDGMIFSTQIFATISNSQMTFRNRMTSF
jgi:uncharacterized protein YkwD